MKLDTHRCSAFSLVEITLALGVAAFCLVGIFGLLPIGLTSNQNAVEQTAAAGVASAVMADLRATPKVSPPVKKDSPNYKITIPATTADVPFKHTLFFYEDGTAGTVDADAAGSTTGGVTKSPRYRATITFAPPANTTARTATTVRLLITWPALADASAVADPKNFSGSYEVVTALDRN